MGKETACISSEVFTLGIFFTKSINRNGYFLSFLNLSLNEVRFNKCNNKIYCKYPSL